MTQLNVNVTNLQAPTGVATDTPEVVKQVTVDSLIKDVGKIAMDGATNGLSSEYVADEIFKLSETHPELKQMPSFVDREAIGKFVNDYYRAHHQQEQDQAKQRQENEATELLIDTGLTGLGCAGSVVGTILTKPAVPLATALAAVAVATCTSFSNKVQKYVAME